MGGSEEFVRPYVRLVRPSALLVLGVAFVYFFRRPSTISPTYAPREYVRIGSPQQQGDSEMFS